MPERSTPASPLSVHRSFVVQFRSDGDGRQLSGRVEHVTSGQATRFASAKELLAFLQRVLGDVEKRPDGSPSGNPIRRRRSNSPVERRS
jgi:hypothetical protein